MSLKISKELFKKGRDYPWPKPGDVERSKKSAYVKKAIVDGKMVVVCAGLYLD